MTSRGQLLKKGLEVIPGDDYLRSELWSIWWEIRFSIVDLELQRQTIPVIESYVRLGWREILRCSLLQDQRGRLCIVYLVPDPNISS